MATASVGMQAPALASLSDDELLRRYVDANDRDALETLFCRHADAAYATALRVCRHATDAQDAIQHAFVKVMQNAADYRGGTGIAAKAWMMKIVIGTCKNRIRSEVRRRKWEERASVGQNLFCLPEDPSASGEEEALHSAIFQELNDLPEHYRLPILLHHSQGLSLKEAAAALSVSENTLHMQLRRGLERLRNALEARGQPASLASLTAILPTLPDAVAPAPLLASFSDIAHGVSKATRAATPLPSGGSIPTALKWVLACLLATGAIVAAVQSLTSDKPAPVTAQVISPVAASVLASSPATARPLSYRWDFNTPGIPPEFTVLKGTLKPAPGEGPDGSGALRAYDAVVRIDVPIETFPFVVTFKTATVNPHINREHLTKSQWLPTQDAAEFWGLSAKVWEAVTPGTRHSKWRIFTDYHGGEWIIRQRDGVFHEILFARARPEGRLTLLLRTDVLIDDISITGISPDQLPDATPYLESLNRLPPESRKGIVEIPPPNVFDAKGKPIRPDGKVTIRFFSHVSPQSVGILAE